LEEDGKVYKVDVVSTFLAAKVLTERGVAKPKVGKSSKISRMLALGITFRLHGRQAQYPSGYM
jgi:hypothetical protein